MSEIAKLSPPEEIEVRIGGETRRVFMSFNLLRRASSLVGAETEVISAFMLDGQKMAMLIDLVLNPKEFNPAEVKDYDIGHSEALRVVQWALEHVLDFFALGLERATGLANKSTDLLSSLMPSVDGLKDSTSLTPVFGPSAPPPVN